MPSTMILTIVWHLHAPKAHAVILQKNKVIASHTIYMHASICSSLGSSQLYTIIAI